METFFIIVAVLAGYGIPIYLGVQSWRNGYRDWVWALVLVTFGILGILGIVISSTENEDANLQIMAGIGIACLLGFYITTWVKTKNPLANSLYCPECGKPSKVRQKVFQDQATGKKVQSPLIGIISFIGGLACIVLFFIGVGIATLVLGIPLLGVGINSFRRSVTQKLEYKCTECDNIFLSEIPI